IRGEDSYFVHRTAAGGYSARRKRRQDARDVHPARQDGASTHYFEEGTVKPKLLRDCEGNGSIPLSASRRAKSRLKPLLSTGQNLRRECCRIYQNCFPDKFHGFECALASRL